MNLDPQEAYCLEILADESEKFSLQNSIYQDTDLNQWCASFNLNSRTKPVQITQNSIPVPRTASSCSRGSRFPSSEAVSKEQYLLRRKKNSRLLTASPNNTIKVVIINTNAIPRTTHSPSDLSFPAYPPDKVKDLTRRASTAIKHYRKSDASKEDSFLSTPSTPPPCRCNITTYKCTDGLFCIYPDCINKLLSKYHKEYNVARHSQCIDRYSALIPKPKIHSKSYLNSHPDRTSETPPRSIGLKRYHKYLHNDSWELSHNTKLYSSLIPKLNDSSFKLPNFTKIHNARSFQKSSPTRLDKKKLTSSRLYSCI